MQLTLTQLRANLYNIVDKIIDSGMPVVVDRHGYKIKIIAEKPKKKLDNLVKHPGTIKGDPDELVHLNWEHEWKQK